MAAGRSVRELANLHAMRYYARTNMLDRRHRLLFIGAVAISGCTGSARKQDDAPLARSPDLGESTNEPTEPGYDFRRVRYYPEEVGQIRLCDVAEPPQKRGSTWTLACHHDHGRARVELSSAPAMVVALGDQLAVHIDAIVGNRDLADVRGRVIERRGRHRVHPPTACICPESRATEHPSTPTYDGFDFARVRFDARLVGTHQRCAIVASSPPSPIDRSATSPDRNLSPELRWKAAVTCGYADGASLVGSSRSRTNGVMIAFRSADVALSLARATMIDVKVIESHALTPIVEEGDWVHVPPHAPPWHQ